MSGILTIFLIFFFVALVFGIVFVEKSFAISLNKVVGFPLLFSTIFMVIFTATFSQIVFTHALIDSFEHRDVRIIKSIAAMIKRLSTILAWVFVTTILRFASRKNEEGKIADAALNLFGFIAGTSWGLLSLFIYSVIAQESRGLLEV